MVFDEVENGVILRVRLSPNSSSCKVMGVFTNSEGVDFLKISVISVPEKGRANQELIKYLSGLFKIAKSDIEIVYGELDRYKKLLIKVDAKIVWEVLRGMCEYDSTGN